MTSPALASRPSPGSHDSLSLSRAATLTSSSSPPQTTDRPAMVGDNEKRSSPPDPVVISFETPGLEKLNPRGWSHRKRFLLAAQGAIQMLCVTFGTSAYTASIPGLQAEFGISNEVGILGLTTFTLALACGSLFWAPCSEVLGRKAVLVSSLTIYSLFGMGPALAKNIETVLICRFLMAFGGSSIMSNSPGMLSDLYNPKEIGLAMTVNSVAPFLGPVLGPIIGGYISDSLPIHTGWRWVNGVVAIFPAVVVVSAAITFPETYASVILRRETKKLEKATGKPHVSIYDAGVPKKTLVEALSVGLKRPFVFLFCEPIVFLLSLYTAVIFAVLYLDFTAFPIIYQQERGWSQGVGGLPFLAMAVGMFLGVGISFYTTGLYHKACAKSPNGRAPPEERLYFAMISAVLLPISLLWFAFTSPETVPWPASVVSNVLFGIGLLGMMTSIMSFLADTYTIYAASVFAGNSLIRYVLGATFPLFGSIMFKNLTPRWALFLLAMIALLMMPMPFLFFKYGARIRSYSKHVPKTVLPPPSKGDDIERQAPPVFLTMGDDAVRVEEMQDSIVPPPGQERDLQRQNSVRGD